MTLPAGFLETPVGDHLAALVLDAFSPRAARTGSEVDPGGPASQSVRSARRFGPHRIIREIGRGGMGTVYLAERSDHRYDRRVAIKTVHFDLAGGLLARRFDEERRILAGLEHPNIARLYDAGTTADGVPYLVMEHVVGRRIDRFCEEGELTVEERLALFDQVCDAVEYAHRKLVVHRDIKPGNVMVTGEGVPKLLDFGIARLVEGTGQSSIDGPTTLGFRALTPEYASPEQLRGEPVTTSADVYALGVLLYVLLSGRHPYESTDRSPAEVERMIRERPARPPSEVSRDAGSKIAGRLRGDLDTIVLTAIRAEPERRYASVEQLRSDIRRHLAGFPVSARPATRRYRAIRFAGRHRAALGAASVTFLALAGGLAGTAWQARAAALEAERAEQTRDYLIALFETFDPDAAGARAVTAEELLDRGALALETDLSTQPATHAALAGVLGQLYQRLGLLAKSRPLLERARAELTSVYGEDHLETAGATARLAALLYDLGEFESAEGMARSALDVRRRLAGPRDTTVANSLSALAAIRGALGHLDESETLHAEALAIDRASGTPEQIAADLDDLGVAHTRLGEHDEALRLLEEALAMRRAQYGERHTEVATSLLNLAAARSAAGDFDGAEHLLDECVAMRRDLLGEEHPHVAVALSNLGQTLQQAGDLEGAEAAHREAFEIRRHVFGEDHPETAASINSLGVIRYFRGDYSGAADQFAKVAGIWEEQLGEEHPDVLTILNNLGAARREAGDYESAEVVLSRVLELRRRVLGNGHPDIGQSLNNLALVQHRLGSNEEAERTYRLAIASWEASLGVDHPTLAFGHEGLGRLLVDTGRHDEAETPLRRAVELREASLEPESSLLASTRAHLGLCLTALGDRVEGEALLRQARPILEDRWGPEDDLVQRVQAELGP